MASEKDLLKLMTGTLKLARRVIDDWKLTPAQRVAILFAIDELVKGKPDIPAVEAALITAHAGALPPDPDLVQVKRAVVAIKKAEPVGSKSAGNGSSKGKTKASKSKPAKKKSRS